MSRNSHRLHSPFAIVGLCDRRRRVALARALRGVGVRVAPVADGYHLVRAIARQILDDVDHRDRPDLIIADCTMPGCTGLSLVAGLRDLGWRVPIFLVVDFNASHQPAFVIGADRVFEKPVDVNEVLCAACEVLRVGTQTPAAGMPRLAGG